jgi:VanZ family protein
MQSWAGLLAYGGMIEVPQSFTPDGMAEWADLLADALGLAVGWGVMRMVSHKRRG